MTVVSIVLMVAGLIGLIVCQKKQKTNPNAQTLAFLFLIVILAGAGCLIYDQFAGGDREMEQYEVNELNYNKARAQAIGEFAGKNWAGQKAVIIVDPNTEKTKIGKANCEALKEALKKAGLDVSDETLDLPKGTDDEPVPAESAYTAKVYNDIFSKNSDANVFVITSQLPSESAELLKMQCWQKFDPKKTRLVLIDAEVRNMKSMITKGIIGAAVVQQSSFDYEKPVPKDLKAAFDARYILITPQNLKEVEGKHSYLFGK